MGEGTRVELDFQQAVVTAGGSIQIYANGATLESVIAKMYEGDSVVAVHVIVEASGDSMRQCGFINPLDDSKYKWPCHNYLIDGVCPSEEAHEEKRKQALQPLLDLATD